MPCTSIHQKLQALEQQAREATEKHQYTLDSAETFYREANAERDRTMAVIKSNQKIANGAISSTTRGIAELKKQLSEAQQEIGELKAAASANRQLINKAARIIKFQEQST